MDEQRPTTDLTVEKILVLADRKPVRQRVEERLEELRVKWALMDEMQKQAVILTGIYAVYTLLDVVGAIAKTRMGGASE